MNLSTFWFVCLQVKSLCKGFSDFKLKEGLLYLLGDEDCQLEVRKSSEHVRLRRMPWTHLGLHIVLRSMTRSLC